MLYTHFVGSIILYFDGEFILESGYPVFIEISVGIMIEIILKVKIYLYVQNL